MYLSVKSTSERMEKIEKKHEALESQIDQLRSFIASLGDIKDIRMRIEGILREHGALRDKLQGLFSSFDSNKRSPSSLSFEGLLTEKANLIEEKISSVLISLEKFKEESIEKIKNPQKELEDTFKVIESERLAQKNTLKQVITHFEGK